MSEGIRSKYADMDPAEILHDYARVRGDIAEDYALAQLAHIWRRQVEDARADSEPAMGARSAERAVPGVVGPDEDGESL